MRRPAAARVLTALLGSGVLLLSGCSSGDDAAVVTITQRIPAPPAADGTDQDGASTPDTTRAGTSSASTAGSTSAESSPDEPGTGTGDGTDDPTDDSATPDSPTSSSEETRTRTSGGSGRPARPTVNAPDADPDTPGPDSGRRCASNADYFDEDPTGLREDVVAGWREIERQANADGIIVCLNDGKRSTQQQLDQYEEYVQQYGKEVADQLVLPPEKSAHVIGVAIDVQPEQAYRWLQATEGSLGFCRTYDNEPWHFEYDVSYFDDGCPARLPRPER